MLDLAPWPEADAILDEALALPPAEREPFLRARVADTALRAALTRVLQEATADDGFLEPGGGTGAALFDDWRDSLSKPAPRLSAGEGVGVYRVMGWLGRGGMGEVYQAHDSSLGRDVALKILPGEVAGDSTRLARFRREARLLASLNHPHIASIYSVVEDEGRLALVLELVEGPTLSERLVAGPLPVRVALELARQVGEAIEAAHQKQVVHRDLKPANIKLSASGNVKVLDFGIAKALSEEGAEGEEVSLTGTGHRAALLGTAAYMSPEQARGEPVDHRTDIWAFACVLYEMLTGQRAFTGDSAIEVLGRVFERQPDFDRLPPETPSSIHRLLRRAFEKNPRRRLGYIGDALLEIEEGLAALGQPAPPAPEAPSRRSGALPLAAAVAAGAVVGALLLWAWRAPAPPGTVAHLAVPMPADHEVVVGQLPALAVSPDGRTLVYRARQGTTMRLFERPLSGGAPVAVPGSEDVAGHALSPDGRSVAFARGGQVFRAALGGGAPVLLGALPGGASLSWGTPDTIVASGGAGGALRRFPASGGPAEAFTKVDTGRGHIAHSAPELLPDGRTVLLTVHAADGAHIGVTTLGSGEVTVLTRGRQPRYLPSGHLVFARERALWVAPFDAGSRQLTGDAVQVVDGVERSTLNAFVHFAVAASGTLFYIPWRERSGLMTLTWHDRQGVGLGTLREGRGLTRFSLSPDGSKVALAVADGDERDVWVLDTTRDATTRLTFDPVPDSQPIWSPDGSLIAFRSDRDGGGVFVRRADGASEARRVTRVRDGFHIPYAFTPDGKQVLFTDFRDYNDQDIRVVDLETQAVEPVLTGPPAEMHPAISPDGRWLAYQSDDSGRFEVYLRPWPEVSRARWQVSVGGGMSPTWRRDGAELFFASGATLMVASFAGGATPRIGKPRPLFAVASSGERLGPQFDVSPDGQRLLVLSPAPVDPVADRPEVRVIQGWGLDLARALGGPGGS
ncbi:MAG: serine/threonine-protein kinase [Acidobacteria bacterium]|nr:serine/threonine-protein kinase [Acidobacteriota bacterium]